MSAGIEDDGIVTASLSHVGRVRSENQDTCGEFQSAAGERLLVVADGMGGHRGGAMASRICVETVARAFADSNICAAVIGTVMLTNPQWDNGTAGANPGEEFGVYALQDIKMVKVADLAGRGSA